MILRIEKSGGGITEEYDFHSPYISFTFFQDGLIIQQEGLNRRLKHQAGERDVGFLNPYTNSIGALVPTIIPYRFLPDKTYTVSYHTDFRGDFVAITGKSKTILINLWGIALLSGLQSVSLDGALVFQGKTIGVLSKSQVSAFPLFFGTYACDGYSEYFAALETFIEKSFRSLRQMLNRRSDSGSQYLLINGFWHFAYNVADDRQSEPLEEREMKAIADAKKLFIKLFGR